MSDLSFSCVAPVGDRCGEAALWCAAEQALYWADINRWLVHRLDARTGDCRSFHFSEPVVALTLTTDPDLLLVALGSRIVLWSSGAHRFARTLFELPDAGPFRFNDGRCGPDGALWIGTMRNNVGPRGELVPIDPGGGKLYRLDRSGAAVLHEGMGIPNTVCWSPDGGRFYLGDTHRNMIQVYPVDGQERLPEGAPFLADYPHGLPDGSAVDAEGCLWNCRFGGRRLVRVDPSGRIDRVVEAPTLNVTTCAFGGADLRTLYVTSATLLTQPDDRLAGGLFAATVDVPGLPERAFQL